MSKKQIVLIVVAFVVIGAFIAYSEISTAATVTGQQTFTDNVTFDGTVNWLKKGVRIGQAGSGGVTFFNGTIVNETTNDGADNPVTFGDNVRIDGEIFRTEVGGSSPLKFADSVIPTKNGSYSIGSSSNRFKDGYFTGTVTMGALGGSGIVSSANLASSSVTSAKIADGAVATGDLANSAVTGAKIADSTITGSDVSSTANLSVASLALAGDATQGITDDGLVKGWAFVSSDGTLIRSYNVVSSSRISDGHFDVKFNFDVSNRVYIGTPSGTSADTAAIRLVGVTTKSGDNTVVRVHTRNILTEAFSDGVFMVTVF